MEYGMNDGTMENTLGYDPSMTMHKLAGMVYPPYEYGYHGYLMPFTQNHMQLKNKDLMKDNIDNFRTDLLNSLSVSKKMKLNPDAPLPLHKLYDLLYGGINEMDYDCIYTIIRCGKSYNEIDKVVKACNFIASQLYNYLLTNGIESLIKPKCVNNLRKTILNEIIYKYTIIASPIDHAALELESATVLDYPKIKGKHLKNKEFYACCHRDVSKLPNGEYYIMTRLIDISSIEKDKVKCAKCEEIFEPVQDMSDEEIKTIVTNTTNLINTIKTKWTDMPEETAIELTKCLETIKELPDINNIASESFNNYTKTHNN